MAANAVFSTVELLEFILEENRIEDLVNAYKVSKIWRDTIDDSVKLRRPLFRSAMRGEVAVWKKGDVQYGGKDPGHWEHASFPPSPVISVAGESTFKLSAPTVKPTFLLNPFLRRFLSTKDRPSLYGEACKCLVFTPSKEHFSFKQCKLAGNSWKDLILTQPPIMASALTAPCNRTLDLTAKVNQSSKVKGVTMGDLATTMARHVNLCDTCDYDSELPWDMFRGNGTFHFRELKDTYNYREVVDALDGLTCGDTQELKLNSVPLYFDPSTKLFERPEKSQ